MGKNVFEKARKKIKMCVCVCVLHYIKLIIYFYRISSGGACLSFSIEQFPAVCEVRWSYSESTWTCRRRSWSSPPGGCFERPFFEIERRLFHFHFRWFRFRFRLTAAEGGHRSSFWRLSPPCWAPGGRPGWRPESWEHHQHWTDWPDRAVKRTFAATGGRARCTAAAAAASQERLNCLLFYHHHFLYLPCAHCC